MPSTKIVKIFVEPLNIPLDQPFTISLGTQYHIENALIILVLESGIEGYGEAAPLEPINHENQATALETLRKCREMLIGRDVANFRQISSQLKVSFPKQATARCAIEMAVLDAYTKSLATPLYRFLGAAEDRVETDYTIDIVSAERAKQMATELSGRGYRVLKTKVGKNLAKDIERILAIKDGAPGCEITLDANQGFSPHEAVHCLKELEKNGIQPILMEQPVIKDDLQGMKFVKDNSPVPVAADETVFTAVDAINVVKSGCADVINIKTMKSGIIEAMDIASIAKAANINLMIGCMLDSVLSMGASVHMAAGLGGFSYVDLDPHGNPENEPFEGGPEFNEPVYSLATCGPGIGVWRRKGASDI